MIEGSQITSKQQASNREEESWERREKDDDLEACTTLKIPLLNLDLSGLDSDVSSNVSSFGKCWKSPEEVRLGYGGRVAALTKHFSKLGDVEPLGRRPGSMKLLESLKKFASEPNVASIQTRQTHSTGRFPALDDNDDDDDDENRSHCRSELDLRDDEIKRRYLSSIDSDETLEKSAVDLSSENSDPNDCCCDRNDLAADSGKRKLSLSEQRQTIEQLREMSDLSIDSRAAGSFFPFRSPSLPSFHLLLNRCSKNIESSDGGVVDAKSFLLLREMQANIEKFASSWPSITNVEERRVPEKKGKRSFIANSYPNIEKAGEFELRNENENEEAKQRWCNSKDCPLGNRLRRATSSSFLTNDRRCFRSLNERDNKNDKESFTVRDPVKSSEENSASRVEGRNHFDILPIEIDRQSPLASMTIEKETCLTFDRDLETRVDTKVDRSWKESVLESKICPRSSETRLNIGFLLRKQLILLSHLLNAYACHCNKKRCHVQEFQRLSNIFDS